MSQSSWLNSLTAPVGVENHARLRAAGRRPRWTGRLRSAPCAGGRPGRTRRPGGRRCRSPWPGRASPPRSRYTCYAQLRIIRIRLRPQLCAVRRSDRGFGPAAWGLCWAAVVVTAHNRDVPCVRSFGRQGAADGSDSRFAGCGGRARGLR